MLRAFSSSGFLSSSLEHGDPRRARQPQYPQAQKRPLDQASPERALPLHADPGFLAQPGGNLVLDPAREILGRWILQLRAHIDAFIETYNADAKPFVWTKSEVHQKRFKA